MILAGIAFWGRLLLLLLLPLLTNVSSGASCVVGMSRVAAPEVELSLQFWVGSRAKVTDCLHSEIQFRRMSHAAVFKMLECLTWRLLKLSSRSSFGWVAARK